MYKINGTANMNAILAASDKGLMYRLLNSVCCFSSSFVLFLFVCYEH
uniref:Uncharacterized protein n=1 Tax=Rhizophora mucronata TaxID=61149 RepID=A0A2P2JMP6_RHIMU